MTDKTSAPGAPQRGGLTPLPAPPTALTVAAAAVACLMGGLYVLDALLAGPAIRRVQEAVRVGDESITDDGLVTLYDALALPIIVATVLAWVVSCAWLAMARRHLVAAAPEHHHARSAVWVWLGWFVPVVLLWFPYQVVRDIYRAAHRTWRDPSLLMWWWGGWLVTIVATRTHDSQVARMLDSGELDAETAQVTGVVTAVATVVALALWLAALRRVSAALGAPADGADPVRT